MSKKTKIVVGLAISSIAVLMLIAVVLMTKPAPTKVTKTSSLLESQEDTKPIPTVGADVQVRLVSVQAKKEVKLVVDGVPASTTTIEYEFTYSTSEQDSEGIFSTAKLKAGETSFPKVFERQITLGTCSRNVCRYHNITSDIMVRLKFEGGYGSRLFEKNFDSSKL